MRWHVILLMNPVNTMDRACTKWGFKVNRNNKEIASNQKEPCSPKITLKDIAYKRLLTAYNTICLQVENILDIPRNMKERSISKLKIQWVGKKFLDKCCIFSSNVSIKYLNPGKRNFECWFSKYIEIFLTREIGVT